MTEAQEAWKLWKPDPVWVIRQGFLEEGTCVSWNLKEVLGGRNCSRQRKTTCAMSPLGGGKNTFCFFAELKEVQQDWKIELL